MLARLTLDLVDDRLAADARDGRFACGVDIGEHEDVSRDECLAELLVQELRARVAMRLEDADQALRARLLGGLERRGDLRRMVRVVVDDPDAICAALRLEAALGTVEGREARRHLLEAHTDREARDDAGHRVEDIVAARDVEIDVAELFLAVEDIERDAHAAVRDVLRAVVGLMVDSVGDVLAVEILGHRAQVLVVEADDSVARLLVDVLDELRESLDDVLHRAVVVHVVVFDIRHDGDVRVELEEGTVTLIRLRHEVIARAELGIRAEVGDFAADDDGRRDARVRQRDV